jgi:hypothetical protein
VGPAGLRRNYNINDLERTETIGISDVSLCLSQSIVSAEPPDKPKMRSPRNGGNRARANRKIEVLNSFEDSIPARQTQRLCRRFALSAPYAEVVAALHFGRAER